MRKRILLYSISFVCLIGSFLLGGHGAFVSTVPANADVYKGFYYFNPDSPQSNLGRLKQEFDTYLSDRDISFAFQPFTHFVDFHRLSSEKQPSFILVPEWYYRKYGKSLGLKPLLVPARNGSTSYKKILLVASGPTIAINDYDIITFAMTNMGSEGETAVVDELVAAHLVSFQQLNIINVPKDLDAIFALVLGQVKMALVSQDNLQVISDTNPRILESIKMLQKSITVPMPVLCYLDGRADLRDVQRMVEIFMKMSAEQPRNKIMEMLQIDDWQKYSE